jgi:hypothetical protein
MATHLMVKTLEFHGNCCPLCVQNDGGEGLLRMANLDPRVPEASLILTKTTLEICATTNICYARCLREENE